MRRTLLPLCQTATLWAAAKLIRSAGDFSHDNYVIIAVFTERHSC